MLDRDWLVLLLAFALFGCGATFSNLVANANAVEARVEVDATLIETSCKAAARASTPAQVEALAGLCRKAEADYEAVRSDYVALVTAAGQGEDIVELLVKVTEEELVLARDVQDIIAEG